ncbi:MAG: hypothetical protein K2P81_15000 [Bacteriovoracaceae bacterium]|nr:hypothetical protein [Bacteriovoracaceae bacterium]
MFTLRSLAIFTLFFALNASAAPVVDSSHMTFYQCKGNCQAKKALTNLKTFSVSKKTTLKNPLGSEVCTEQLGGVVGQFADKKKGSISICRFKDNSAIELQGLHRESEKFTTP